MGDFRDGTVDSNGVAIAVRDFGGEGSPIVLVHGNGLSLASWDRMVPHLSDLHRVVALDLRGQGLSGDGTFTWDAALADLRAVIEHFALDAPAIVGHSLGGMLAALHGATDRPCRAAVNLDGHGLEIGIAADEPEEAAVRVRMMSLIGEATAAHFEPIPAATLEAQLATVGDEDVEGARANLQRQIVEQPDGTFRLRLTREALDQVMSAVNSIDLFDVCRACRVPLLIVNAVKDDAAASASPEMAELTRTRRPVLNANLRKLAEGQPHIEVEEVDATHGLITEIPEQLAKTVSAFVEGS